jgi:dethiobiotin synthetase
MKRYFIIGTDTDCGKTYVTTQLVEHFKRCKQRVLAIKPLATGCNEVDGRLTSDDANELNQHHGYVLDERQFYRFKSPVSPHLAAEEAEIELSIESIAALCDKHTTDMFDVLLIEGAGGLMVPLNSKDTWIDFLIHTKIPVILVVGMKLGCLNHAALTASVLKSQGIATLGWIANCIDPHMLALERNIQTLGERLPFPLLATVPFMGGELIQSPSSSQLLRGGDQVLQPTRC